MPPMYRTPLTLLLRRIFVALRLTLILIRGLRPVCAFQGLFLVEFAEVVGGLEGFHEMVEVALLLILALVAMRI